MQNTYMFSAKVEMHCVSKHIPNGKNRTLKQTRRNFHIDLRFYTFVSHYPPIYRRTFIGHRTEKSFNV